MSYILYIIISYNPLGLYLKCNVYFTKMKNLIKFIRRQHGLSQEDLAKKVDVTRQAIIDLEKGKYLPNVLLAHNIAKALHTSIDNLFIFDSDEEKPDYIH